MAVQLADSAIMTGKAAILGAATALSLSNSNTSWSGSLFSFTTGATLYSLLPPTAQKVYLLSSALCFFKPIIEGVTEVTSFPLKEVTHVATDFTEGSGQGFLLPCLAAGFSIVSRLLQGDSSKQNSITSTIAALTSLAVYYTGPVIANDVFRRINDQPMDSMRYLASQIASMSTYIIIYERGK